jgi:hypothetical protein
MYENLVDRHFQSRKPVENVVTKDSTFNLSDVRHVLSAFEQQIMCVRTAKNIKKTLLCICLFLTLTIVVNIEQALSMSDQEIFNWVARQLNINKEYPMPKILVVSKEELQDAFKKQTEQSYQRWIKEYGENTAKETMNMYLTEVIGLFNPKSKVIYVGSFMEPCRFKSIVAHEITHYLQVMENGQVELGSALFDNVHFFRELQANGITNDYVKAFCGPWGSPGILETRWNPQK